MSDIYVHNNNGRIQFNCYVYAFVRAWYIPSVANLSIRDTWFKVPALRLGQGEGKSSYSLSSVHMQNLAAVLVSADSGRILKGSRGKDEIVLTASVMDTIRLEAFDISDWEYQNKQGWPYSSMVDNRQIKSRQALAKTNGMVYSGSSTSKAYMQTRRSMLPRPCGCGKRKRK